MFTGIIKHQGRVTELAPLPDNALQLSLTTSLPGPLETGTSVAVNGACLSVLSHTDDQLTFRLMHETLQKTNLGQLRLEDSVNLELPLAVGERLDGHFVLGHIDAPATISNITRQGDDQIYTITPPPEYLPLCIPKGSIALDGVSLTIVAVSDTAFTVSLMPYTLHHTTLSTYNPGDSVNLETDMIGKYVHQLLPPTP